MSTTETVLEHHLQALRNGDLDGLLADYDEDCVVATPEGTIRGKAALRDFCGGIVAELLPPGSTFDEVTRVVEGDYAYIVWSAESEGYRFPFATDTFVVQGGKVVFQSFAGHLEPK